MPFAWTSADFLDPPWGCTTRAGYAAYTQLYNLDAVAYESIVVGFFTIFTGKYCGTGACQPLGHPHLNRSVHECGADPGVGMNRTGEWDSVFVGYSRDGFHWFRPVDADTNEHRVFLPQDATPVRCNGDATGGHGIECNWRWNKANVQSVGGGVIVPNGGAMRFYVGARTGVEQLIGNATAGVAELRRDGFASVGPVAAARGGSSAAESSGTARSSTAAESSGTAAESSGTAAESSGTARSSAAACVVRPGTNPVDTDGNVVHAHGAGMYAENGTLYLLGTTQKEAVRADASNSTSPLVYLSKSINLYSTTPTKDGLCKWKFHGVVATRAHIEGSMKPPLPPGVTARVERPKLAKASV